MKIFSIVIVRKDTSGARIVAAEYDVSSFGYFQRSSAQEWMAFSSKTIAERTEKGIRQTIEENEKMAYAYTNLSGLSCVIICDQEYPQRVAFALINRILEEFTAAYPRDVWLITTTQLDFPKLAETLLKYQDPHEADPIMKVQRELDETKVILHKTMNSLLERGEKLDDLVARSDELGIQSKMFFKSAKKTNSCCVVQ